MGHSFQVADYVIFALTLVISIGIGVYFAVGRRANHEPGQFLVGGRQMPILPTALSLLTSFISGIAILAYPAEIYTRGTAFVWTGLGAVLAIAFTGVCLIPVLHRIQSCSVYYYFEERFQSKAVRLLASLMFSLTTVTYLSAVLFAPSTALAGVTGLPIWALIGAVGAVCTLYTTIGGLRAVIWTDTFQAFVMFAGCIALAVQGTVKAGGWHAVWRVSSANRRLQGLQNIDPDPFQYMTVWTAIFGGFFYWMGAFGANQMALQRYCSLPTVPRAQIVVLLNVPSILLVLAIVFYTGLAMFAYYAACDPLTTRQVKTPDQLVVWFMLEMLGEIPGLAGLFVACLFSGTLSTISSGINSLSAVAWEDYVQPFLLWKGCSSIKEHYASGIVKSLSLIYGLATIGLAFLAEPLGGVLMTVIKGIGCFSGPLVGLMLLGVLCKFPNYYGALSGTLIGIIVNLWIFIGSTLWGVNPPSLPLSTENCTHLNDSLKWSSQVQEQEFLFGFSKIYSVSTMLYALIGALTVLFVGGIVSFFTNKLKGLL